MGYKVNIEYNGNKKNIASRKRSDSIKYHTDGKDHDVEIEGDAALGIGAALSAILGFAVGLFLFKRF